MTPVAHALTAMDIGPLGATVRYLINTMAEHGLRTDRVHILNAARELDWRVAPNGGHEVVMPPAGQPIKLTSYDAD